MSSSINTNLASLIAQLNATRTQRSLSTAIARLSSGLRINGAADDAAGLAISNRFTAQIRGLSQAARNTNDGISVMQTADGGLSNIGDMLQRMRELAVEAANGTSSASDRAAAQLEVSQLAQEVDRISTSTSFNGRSLLDGSFTSQRMQVGANVGQTVDLSVGSARLAYLMTTTQTVPGAPTYSLSTTKSTFSLGYFRNGGTWQRNWLVPTSVTVAGSAGSSVVSTGTGDSAKMIADAVNLVSGSTGVTATASNTFEMVFSTPPGHIDFQFEGATPMNGTPGANSVPMVADIWSSGDYVQLANAFNGAAGITGVTAVATATGVILTSAAGDDLRLANYTASAGPGTVELIDSAGTDQQIISGSSYADSATLGGVVTFASSNPFTVTNASGGQLFDTTGAHAGVGGGAGPPVTSTFVSSLDVTTALAATQTITALDQALAKVSANRAGVGAFQNRLASLLGNLNVTNDTFQSARGRIVDADFAAETANLARGQILQNAALAMIAQANVAPDRIVALLRSTVLSR